MDVSKRSFPFSAKISAIAYPNPLEAPVIIMFLPPILEEELLVSMLKNLFCNLQTQFEKE